MQGLIEHLKSTEFWTFSVCLAMVLSVAANYVTRVLDRTFSAGSAWLRSMSFRSRERRAARARLITEWIDTHDNGMVLALNEAHFISLVGLIFSVTFLLGALVALSVYPKTMTTSNQIIVILFMVIFGVLGLAAMISGTEILDVVREHPKGLKGLHPSQKGPPSSSV